MKHVMMYGAIAACLVILIGWLAAGTAFGGVSAQSDAAPAPDLDDVLQVAQLFHGGNADWTPIIEEIDGVEMVLVPAGCFQMGSTAEQIEVAVQYYTTQHERPGQADWFFDETPPHQICFEQPFWIDRTEVSNQQFDQWNGQAEMPPFFSGHDLPRGRITWFEARDFCEQRRAHLPTEAEWEYAARGPDSLIFPWGNHFEWDRVGGDRDFTVATLPVGSVASGASWVGARDMSGNVWEWTSSMYWPYPFNATDGRENISDEGLDRVLRGGSWYHSSIVAKRTVSRLSWNPQFENDDIGFRCARLIDVQSLPETQVPISKPPLDLVLPQ